MVDELLDLWNDGIEVKIKDYGDATQKIYAALLLVSCDLPATRKVMGFTGYRQACSRCTKEFPQIGPHIFDCSGYEDYKEWTRRSREAHVYYGEL